MFPLSLMNSLEPHMYTHTTTKLALQFHSIHLFKTKTTSHWSIYYWEFMFFRCVSFQILGQLTLFPVLPTLALTAVEKNGGGRPVTTYHML